MFKKVDVKMFDARGRISNATKFGQYILDNAVLKDSNKYVPRDEDYLMKSGILHTKPGTGKVMWQMPYARRLYYNPQYNFSKDKNPNAQGLWYEAAKAQNRQHWIDQYEKAVKSKL